MFKLIIAEDKQGLVRGKSRPKNTRWGLGEVGLRISLQKYESWENICMCLYLENRDKIILENKISGMAECN